MQDEMYMARALKLAARGRFTTHPNPNVVCVIVKDGEIVESGSVDQIFRAPRHPWTRQLLSAFGQTPLRYN